MSICFLAGTLGQGGAERQLFYILKALTSAGAVVHLLTLEQGGYWEKPISELRVSLHFVGASPSRLARLLKIAKTVRRIYIQHLIILIRVQRLRIIGAA